MSIDLVTGGAGFIGSNLVEKLLGEGRQVTVLDDLSTGSLENLQGFKDNNALEFIEGSILNKDLVERLVDKATRVFHLAAVVGVRAVVENPLGMMDVNVMGSHSLISTTMEAGKKIFIASSSEVYGKSEDLPFRESGDLLIGPTSSIRWSYAVGKQLDEFLAIAYAKQKKSPYVVGRFFNTVGPRQNARYGMVIPRFFKQAQSGETLTVYGNGDQKRSFCHVKDVVKAVAAIMDSDSCVGETFNIGASDPISINKLADRIIELTGSSSKKELIPFEKAFDSTFEEPKSRVPDVSKLVEAIEWKREYQLEDILQDIWARKTEL